MVIGGALCGAGHSLTGGYFLSAYANHTFAVTKTASWPLNGDQEILAHGPLAPPHAGVQPQRRRLKLTAVGSVIVADVDGRKVATVVDAAHVRGFAALASGWHRTAVFSASVNACEE